MVVFFPSLFPRAITSENHSLPADRGKKEGGEREKKFFKGLTVKWEHQFWMSRQARSGDGGNEISASPFLKLRWRGSKSCASDLI